MLLEIFQYYPKDVLVLLSETNSRFLESQELKSLGEGVRVIREDSIFYKDLYHLFLIFGSARVYTQVLAIARQALSHLR
jgi:hypothetical protein